jgi:hypothetical protein
VSWYQNVQVANDKKRGNGFTAVYATVHSKNASKRTGRKEVEEKRPPNGGDLDEERSNTKSITDLHHQPHTPHSYSTPADSDSIAIFRGHG